MHICVNNVTIIGLDNGSSPGRDYAIIWTNAEILLTGISWTNLSELFIEMLSGNKPLPEPISTKICVNIWCH